MRINNIQPCQNQNFKARLVKTPSLNYLLEKISDDYSRRDATKLCKKLRKLKPDSLTIKVPEMISDYNGRKIVVDLTDKNKKAGKYFVMPVSESRTSIMYPTKIFRNIKRVVQFYNDNVIAK